MSEIVPINYEMMWKVSQRVTNTPFVPKALQGKPESVLACILYGAEMGIGPMQSLNSIHVIEGRASMSPELMRAMVARHGHRIDVIENSSEACEMKGIRHDTGSTATVKWTMADAKKAGLTGKTNWDRYPRAMLMARCTSELCRILFPDIIAGLSYTPEEVASIEGVELPMDELIAEVMQEEEEVAEAEIVEEAAPAPRKRNTKVGSAIMDAVVEAEDIATVLKETGIIGNSTAPGFDERLAIAEGWGGWPFVKGIASMCAKAVGCEKAETFHALANNEALWLRTQEAMADRGK